MGAQEAGASVSPTMRFLNVRSFCNMKVVFIEVIRGFWRNSYKELGSKEMDIIPNKDDVIQREGSNWVVRLRRFMFDTEEGNYVKVYIEPYEL